jgi:hypothetical protein
MARIPVYEQRTQLSGQVQGGRISGQSPIAGAAAQLSQDIQQVGGQLAANEEMRNRIEEQKTEDRAAVTVANVLSQGDVHWQQQYDERTKNWKPGDPDLREGISKDFDAWKAKTIKDLPTERSRQFFERSTASMGARLQMSAYEFQDKATLGAMVSETTVGMKADEDIVYRDPSRLDEVKARRLATLGAMKGIPEGKKLEIGQKYTQDMAYAVERGELERDPVAFLAKRRVPTGGDPTVVTREAVPFDRLFTAVVGQESGGVHTTADGKLLTSTAGAQGVTQVMPRTGEDPGYGVAPLRDQSKAEYMRFGRDYLTAMLTEYGGDQAKALAAYNAGPGRVNDAVRKHGADWLSHMPDETKNYVTKISAKAGGAVVEMAPAREDSASTGTTPARMGPATFETLPFEQREALLAAADSRMKQRQAQNESDMNRRLADATAMHADGKMDPFNMGPQDFDRAYGADGQRRFQEYRSSRDMASDVARFQTLPPEQIQGILQKAQAETAAIAAVSGEGYAAADRRNQVRIAAAKAVIEQQQKDPQAYAMRAGLSNAQPLDFNNTEAFGAELANRVATAKMMNQQYSTPFRLMTDQETRQMTEVMSKFPAAAKVDYLNTIRRSVSDPAAYRSMMAQIAPDSPVTAVAGSILGKDTGVTVGAGWFKDGSTLTPRGVATTIIQGEQILNPNAAAKKQDGRGGNFPMPKDSDMEREFADFVGESFRGDAAGYGAAFQAFRAYYAGKASERGILSPDLDTKISREALEAVTGGVSDFNGNGRVLKPWGMPDDEFENRARFQFDQAMTANGLKGTRMDDFDSYGLQALRDNQYLVTSGGAYLLGKDGQPVVIDTSIAPPPVVAPAQRQQSMTQGDNPLAFGPENKFQPSDDAPSVYASAAEWAEYRKKKGAQ